MMLYFVVFKHKKDKEYKLFTNIVFDKENEDIKDINVISTRNARLIMSGDVYIKKSLID